MVVCDLFVRMVADLLACHIHVAVLAKCQVFVNVTYQIRVLHAAGLVDSRDQLKAVAHNFDASWELEESEGCAQTPLIQNWLQIKILSGCLVIAFNIVV